MYTERRTTLNPNIDFILNTFYQRGITSREQLLTEMLRVKKTLEIINSENNEKILNDKEKLFQLMKKSTEQELGFFPGDRDFFLKVFELCIDADLIEYTLEIYKNDRMGIVIAPSYLTEFIYKFIDEKDAEVILITEAEKHLSGLAALVEKYPEKKFTFTTQFSQMYLMLTLGFEKYENVKIVHQSIYSELIINDRFDFIYCLPTFAGKGDELNNKFITNQTDGIAIENMLPMLSDNGVLTVIVPARITFTGGNFAKLREYITQNYNVDSILMLPEGTFRPYTAIKTYMLNISKTRKDAITVGTVAYENDKFKTAEQKVISMMEFLNHEDWRIEIILSSDDENIKKFKSSNLERVKLKDIAEIFRGKSILKKDVSIGKIAVLNISDIDNGEINYSNMDSIDEEERKIKRYELADGDLVLTCRGTAIKTAVFRKQDRTVIASANVIVIRPKAQVLGEYVKIFFESPIGTTLIKSFQRGTTIMNINHSDIMEIEIPIVPMTQQLELTQEHERECQIYKETVEKAEIRWQDIKNKLYEKLY